MRSGNDGRLETIAMVAIIGIRTLQRWMPVILVAVLVSSLWIALRPTPLASQSGLTFVAPPRISKDVFTAVLRRGTGGGPSPAAPYASELYDIIVSYGIDPGVALAFFAHESSLCTAGVCFNNDTKSWGAQRRAINPSRSSGFAPGASGTFAIYRSWPDGVRDWCELILARYVNRGLDTIERAIPVYAPASDGNVPTAYINSIYRFVGAWQGRQPGALGGQQPRHTYESSVEEALIVETFLSAEIEFRPEWAFHKFMLDEARAGRPLGAPLDESRVITVNNQSFAIQVFAYDTLYTPLANNVNETDWGDVRRMSGLFLLQGQAATPGDAALGEALEEATEDVPANVIR